MSRKKGKDYAVYAGRIYCWADDLESNWRNYKTSLWYEARCM